MFTFAKIKVFLPPLNGLDIGYVVAKLDKNKQKRRFLFGCFI